MKTIEAHLAALRSTGMTIVENLISTEDLARIKEQTYLRLSEVEPEAPECDTRLGLSNAIAWSAEVCRAVTHATALGVIRGYLGTDEIHFGHNPVMTLLRPAKETLGQYPESGWHSDYPYHQDVFPESRWPDETVYALQFNICIDEFRADNGGTQYLPNSHLTRQFVPAEFNANGTRMGQYPFQDVKQMQAPAGSALIYDARIWHRACGELNVSGQDRLAVLNAVTPNWVIPMADRAAGREEFLASGMSKQLDDRVLKELSALCHSDVADPPKGAPDLTPKVRSAKSFKL